MSILDEMKVRRLYCDGGMGSLLQAAGDALMGNTRTHPEHDG